MRDLIRWAKAVADGDPLDPAHAAASGDPERDRLLQQFQIVAEIARLHRATATSGAAAPTPPEPPDAGDSAAAKWGHLTLVERIAQGSFGDVYRAWDARLDRFVALKLLYRDEQDGDTPQRAVIEEGRLLARLRHPNVVPVYGADRIDGRVGIWMELINGRTLEDLVSSNGPFGAAEATLIALDACRALAAIHQAGLLHRDLKARNVMRERGGRIVVMDLGAGRPREPRDDRRDLVGTPLYLAPELFAGEPASVRSDIYSLGVLLYFLVTGTTPVTGANAAEVRASHDAGRRVPLREVRPDLPEDFISTVQRALAPNPIDRFSSAASLADSLPHLRSTETADDALLQQRRRRQRMAWGAVTAGAMVVAATVGVIVTAALRPPAPRPPERRLLIEPSNLRIDSVAVSPDARTLAFAGPGLGADDVGALRLWLRPLDGFEARPVPDSEGATYPFWSPDSGSLGFFARGKLWIVSATGGAPRVLADAPLGRGAAWGGDDQIVYAPGVYSPLYRVSARGGTPVVVTTLDAAYGDTGHRWPTFLPDGRRVAFLRLCRPWSHSGTFVSALDGSPPRKLIDATARLSTMRPDVLVYARDMKLLAQQVDYDRVRLLGEPRTLTQELALHPDTRDAVFGVSSATLGAGVDTNAMAFGITTPLVSRFDVRDRGGRLIVSREMSGLVRSFAISPDGRRLAVERLDPEQGTDDIWTLDLESGQLVRLTAEAWNDTDPVWSPDGREILFSSDRHGHGYAVFRRSSDPGGPETRFATAPMSMFPEDWGSDGSVLTIGGEDGSRLLYLLPPGQPQSPRVLLDSTAQQDEPAFSPDARLIAYHSTDSGAAEVFVTRADDRGRRWQVSRGGVQPRWRADGRELFYLSLDGQMMVAPILAGTPFKVGTARPLFATGLTPSFLINDYVVSPDGQRLVVKYEEGGRVTRLGVILDWRSPWGNERR